MNQLESQKPRRVRAKPRLVEVVRVDHLTPHMAQIVFAGEELEGFTTRGPAKHLKVNFPPAGEPKLVLPEWGPEGPILMAGQQRPLNRTYTPRRWDMEAGELTVDFLLHGEGPGSTLAQQALPGQVVAVSHQTGGAYKVDAAATLYLLGGDEAALPAVGTLLEALPASCSAHVFVEVADAHEELTLESSARFQVTWLHHGRAIGRVGRKAGAGGAEVLISGGQWPGLDRLRSRRYAGHSSPPFARARHGPNSRPYSRLLEVRRHESSRQRPGGRM
jgi:NADPH-dependent ferric siderophore reductase